MPLSFNSSLKFFENPSNFTLMFHGTPLQYNVSQLCCNSFDPSHRGTYCGQTICKGEYFTNKFTTARKYAYEKGAVVLTLIINPQLLKNTKFDNSIQIIDTIPDFWLSGGDEDFKNFELPKTQSDNTCVWYNNEQFYIVNNLTNMTFCLPIAIIQSVNNIAPYVFCHRKKMNFI